VLSGGDDKAVRVFERSESKSEHSEKGSEWLPVARWAAAKKVSAACFAGPDSPHAIAADKFGDVVCGPATAAEALEAAARPARPLWRGAPELFAAKKLAPDRGRGKSGGGGVAGGGGGGGAGGGEGGATAAAAAVAAPAAAAAPAATKGGEPAGSLPAPLPLFGHFCTVVTALALSSDSAALASCDRDGKVRVTRLPPGGALAARGGAPEALAFCLGHTAFCTGVAFLEAAPRNGGAGSPSAPPPAASPPSPPSSPSYLVASSSGDGCVRLWGCHADARGGMPLAALPCSEAATEAARRRGEACKRVAEVVAARRAAKARVTAALPFGGEKKAKKEEEEEGGEKGANGGGADGNENGNGNGNGSDGGDEGGEEDEDDFAGLDLPSSLAAPPAVVCLAGDGRGTLVAAVEGEPELLVIEVLAGNPGGAPPTSPSPPSPLLRVSARVAVPGVARPTSLALDATRGLVWAAGVDERTGKLAVCFAELPSAAAGGDGRGTPLPSAEALRALCDAADAGAVSPVPPQISQDLRRSLVSPRVMKKGSK